MLQMLTLRRRARAMRAAAVAAGLGAVVATTALTGATPAAASGGTPVLFGAAAGTKQQILDHEALLHSRLNGVRIYRSWDDEVVPSYLLWARDTGHRLFLSIRSQRHDGSLVPYSAILAAQPGDPLYADMVRQGQQIKAFGQPLYVAYNHEPDAGRAQAMGTPAEFAAAYRKVVGIWRAQGATNLRTVVAFTAYAYTRGDGQNARFYYPGDAAVDYIAADAYNWYDCARAGGAWRSLAAVIEGQREFGRLHPSKGLMLYEFGSVEDPQAPGRKAAWLADATKLLAQPAYDQYVVALTWEGRNFSGSPSCTFDYLSSPSATQAWLSMAHAPSMSATRVR